MIISTLEEYLQQNAVIQRKIDKWIQDNQDKFTFKSFDYVVYGSGGKIILSGHLYHFSKELFTRQKLEEIRKHIITSISDDLGIQINESQVCFTHSFDLQITTEDFFEQGGFVTIE